MFRSICRYRSVFITMTLLSILTAIPLDQAVAALIQTTRTEPPEDSLRAQVMALLNREEVKLALLQQGVDPKEVEARVTAMTDAEVAMISKTLPNMPAGGELFLTVLLIVAGMGAIVGAFLVLLIWAGVSLVRSSTKEAPAPTK